MKINAIAKFMALSIMAAFLLGGNAGAALITTYYGDEDGFGVGAHSGSMDPEVSNADGDVPFTDVRLIGGGFAPPPFEPTGSFDLFVIAPETILSATLTMRAGAWDTNPTELDPPQRLFLDGLGVSSSFFDLFDANDGYEGEGANLIETESILLDASFFPLLADGAVSLNGTHLSERSGSGSFQIDFLRLDIVTTGDGGEIPEPASLTLLALGLGGMVIRRIRKRA